MQDTGDLKGQLCRLPDGQKVIVDSLEGVTASAVVLRIDGPRAGTPAVCLVSKLKPLDSRKTTLPKNY